MKEPHIESYLHAPTVRAFCHFLSALRRCFLFCARDMRYRSRCCGWMAAWIILVTPVAALDAGRKADSYSIQGWFTEHGLPSNKIRAMTQTRDGYLWIATAQGLARFDGNRFTIFTAATHPELRGGGFFAVLEAPDGTLWFGGDNGLFRWRNGQFDRFTTEQGLAHNYVRALTLTRDGRIVALTLNGYSFIRDDRITTPGGLWKQATGVARSYLERADGSILLGTSDGLWRISGENIEQLSGIAGLEGDSFRCLLETSDGSIWIGHGHGLRRVYPDGRSEDYGAAKGLTDSDISVLRTDHDGNLWIGTYSGGLYRLAHGQIEATTYAEQFGGTPIRDLYEDRESGLWVATATGLFRLKDNVGSSIGTAEGMTQTSVYSVLETRDGAWWIGLWGGGIYRYDQKRATRLALAAEGDLDEVLSFAEEPDGTLWIGGTSGLYRHAGGVTTNLYQRAQAAAWQKQIAERPDTLLPGLAHNRVNSITPDNEGKLWVATEGALYHGREGSFRAYTTNDGLPGNMFKSVIRAGNGDIWVTAPPQGVASLHEGRWTNYLCGKVISGVSPRAVYEDSAGTIWVTTEGGGLNRFKDGCWRTFTARDGLADDFISGITEDNFGNLWIAFPRGIMRLPHEQFDEFDAGRRDALLPRIVNRSDGLPAAESNHRGSPSAWRSRDGRLLFATDRGVAVIEPDNLKINTLVPPIYVERVVVNGAEADLSRSLVVLPGNNDVQIYYTAISLLASEKVRFKIRLAPLDRDWVEVGGQREVRYPKLPPGDYTFNVIACNNDGVWNEQGVTRAFTVQPFFYQTGWFTGLMVMIAGSVVFGFYWTRRLQSAKKTAEATVSAKNEFITALKHAQEEAAYERDLLRALLDYSPDQIYFKDAQSRFVKVGRLMAKNFGVESPDQLVGRTDFEFFTEAHARPAFEDELEIIRTGQPMIGKVEKESWKGGRESWVLTTKMPFRNNDGEIIGTFGISKDITAIKEAEELLRQQNVYLNALQETSLEVVSQLDLDHLLENILKRAGQLMGTSSGCLDLLEPGNDYLTPKIALGVLAEESLKFNVRRGEGMCGKVWQTGQPMQVDDYDAWSGRRKDHKNNLIQSIIEVPLLSKSGFMGVLGLAHEKGTDRTFGPEAIERLSQFARFVTIAIENARLYSTLQRELTERTRAETKLEQVHKQLLETSRQAGMSEVASNVLHNVGNVLNSVNVSASLLVEGVKKSKSSSLAKVVALLREHEQDLGTFFTSDRRGKQLPAYLAQLSEHLLADQKATVAELISLRENIEHIKNIVAMQQSYAKVSGVKEIVNVRDLVEDSLRMNVGSLTRHGVEVVREFEDVPPLNVEKHKILQILVNLLRNAKQACDEGERTDKRVTLRITNGDGRVRISVSDNGIGILPENLTCIFNHGFTTRKDGHGFGLHSGALAAKEMGGAISVQSDGLGRGATFTLELPSIPIDAKPAANSPGYMS